MQWFPNVFGLPSPWHSGQSLVSHYKQAITNTNPFLKQIQRICISQIKLHLTNPLICYFHVNCYTNIAPLFTWIYLIIALLFLNDLFGAFHWSKRDNTSLGTTRLVQGWRCGYTNSDKRWKINNGTRVVELQAHPGLRKKGHYSSERKNKIAMKQIHEWFKGWNISANERMPISHVVIFWMQLLCLTTPSQMVIFPWAL